MKFFICRTLCYFISYIILFNRLERSLSSKVPDLCKLSSSLNQQNASQNWKLSTFENTSNKQKFQVKASGGVRYREISRENDKKLLKSFYITNKNPNKKEREQLARQTQLTDKQLRTWFKNQSKKTAKKK